MPSDKIESVYAAAPPPPPPPASCLQGHGLFSTWARRDAHGAHGTTRGLKPSPVSGGISNLLEPRTVRQLRSTRKARDVAAKAEKLRLLVGLTLLISSAGALDFCCLKAGKWQGPDSTQVTTQDMRANAVRDSSKPRTEALLRQSDAL